MPQITISIDEQQEVKILEHINARTGFKLDGGELFDSKGNLVRLSGITFEFRRDPVCLETFDCANGDHSDCCPAQKPEV